MSASFHWRTIYCVIACRGKWEYETTRLTMACFETCSCAHRSESKSFNSHGQCYKVLLGTKVLYEKPLGAQS